MKIRPAKLSPSDIKDIGALVSVLDFEKENSPITNATAEQVSKAIKRNEYLVAESHKKLVGAIRILYGSNQSCEIHTLVANPRLGGVGSQLVKATELFCKNSDIKKLWAWSLVRYDAWGFYQKMGFTEVHFMEKQFFGEDAYFFGKVIK